MHHLKIDNYFHLSLISLILYLLYDLGDIISPLIKKKIATVNSVKKNIPL